MSHYYTVKRVCEVCGREFMGERWRVNRGLERFCSQVCTNVWKRQDPKFHKPMPEETRKKISRSHFGIMQTEESKRKIRLARARQVIPPEIYKSNGLRNRDENHKKWKGDKAGYRSKHIWVETRLGKPDKCDKCGKTGLTGRQIHWSNKSGSYLRELSDWQRLCVKCHKEYDCA